MAKVNILKSSLFSAHGNLEDTLKSIEENKLNLSSKSIETLDGLVEVPYFLFHKEMEENQDIIYKAIKSIVLELIVDLTSEQRKNTALLIGTSQIDLNIVNSIVDTLDDTIEFKSDKKSIDNYAKKISNELNLSGYTMTMSTACTSSANALLEAQNLISANIFKYVLVLGVEVHTSIMCSGFNSLRLLSLGKQTPFSKERDGLVLGEGLAGVLIGEEDSTWSLEGGYSNANSYTITASGVDGDEFYDVMNKALKKLKLKSKDITALKSHATSSVSNDLSEINAISRIFDKNIVFTALKPYVGHTLGACGILELVLFMAGIDKGFIHKTINVGESILDDYTPITKDYICTNGTFMLNYFGFAGNNVSIIIKKSQ